MKSKICFNGIFLWAQNRIKIYFNVLGTAGNVELNVL